MESLKEIIAAHKRCEILHGTLGESHPNQHTGLTDLNSDCNF